MCSIIEGWKGICGCQAIFGRHRHSYDNPNVAGQKGLGGLQALRGETLSLWARHAATSDARRGCAGLTRVQSPWVLAPLVAWDERLIRRAVIWLALRVSKAILRLTDADYADHHLQVRHGRAGHLLLHHTFCTQQYWLRSAR